MLLVDILSDTPLRNKIVFSMSFLFLSFLFLFIIICKGMPKYLFPTRRGGTEMLLQKSNSPTFYLSLHSTNCAYLFYIEYNTIKLLTKFDVCDKMLFAIQSMYQYIYICFVKFWMPSPNVLKRSKNDLLHG